MEAGDDAVFLSGDQNRKCMLGILSGFWLSIGCLLAEEIIWPPFWIVTYASETSEKKSTVVIIINDRSFSELLTLVEA